MSNKLPKEFDSKYAFSNLLSVVSDVMPLNKVKSSISGRKSAKLTTLYVVAFLMAAYNSAASKDSFGVDKRLTIVPF